MSATRRLKPSGAPIHLEGQGNWQSVGSCICLKTVTPAYPTPRPSAPPITAIRKLSVISRRMMRSDRHRRRAARLFHERGPARDSSADPATLAQATNNTDADSKVSIAIKVASIGSCASRACSSLRTSRFRLRFVYWIGPFKSLPMTDSSVCASVICTPGFRRPFRGWAPRVARLERAGLETELMRGHIIRGA